MKKERGFTLVELLIVVAIVAIVIFGFVGFVMGDKESSEEYAKVWAQGMGYETLGVVCQSTDSDNNGKISCDVRVKGQDTPIALDCNFWTNSCTQRMMTQVQTPSPW